MITSFINTEQSEHTGLIFIIPQLTIILIIIQVIYDLCCREMFVTDKEVRQAYKTNIIYILVFTLMHFPMLLLIYITSGKKEGINQDDFNLGIVKLSLLNDKKTADEVEESDDRQEIIDAVSVITFVKVNMHIVIQKSKNIFENIKLNNSNLLS